MTISVLENALSRGTKVGRSETDQSGELSFFVVGTDDYTAAQAAALSSLPARFNFSALFSILQLDPIAPDVWQGRASYVAPDEDDEENKPANMPRAIGQATFAFSTGGGTQTIREANAQRHYPASAADMMKQINVGPDGVDGVEIVVPELRLEVTQKFAGNSISAAYLVALAGATGKTNSDGFMGFAPGELLLLETSGSQPLEWTEAGTTQYGERDVRFSFSVSPNQTGLEVGSITGIDKNGHEYLWTRYKQDVDAGELVRRPIGVYVAEVYSSVDMGATLGIVDPIANAASAGDFGHALVGDND